MIALWIMTLYNYTFRHFFLHLIATILYMSRESRRQWRRRRWNTEKRGSTKNLIAIIRSVIFYASCLLPMTSDHWPLQSKVILESIIHILYLFNSMGVTSELLLLGGLIIICYFLLGICNVGQDGVQARNQPRKDWNRNYGTSWNQY